MHSGGKVVHVEPRVELIQVRCVGHVSSRVAGTGGVGSTAHQFQVPERLMGVYTHILSLYFVLKVLLGFAKFSPKCDISLSECCFVTLLNYAVFFTLSFKMINNTHIKHPKSACGLTIVIY